MKKQEKQIDIDSPEVQTDKPHRPECVGRPEGLPTVKLAELLEREPENNEHDNVVKPIHLKPHRSEIVERPIGLLPLKLSELLEQEPKNNESDEIDTGPPVGNEIW